jgi:2-keto-4-pentenoate hydratase/2-oxohepta-3-ene-1,7-dioic acid hydratase in catechol pathway
MKLLRFGSAGNERPGLIDSGGKIRDLSGVIGDIGGEILSDAGLERLRGLDTQHLPEVDAGVRLGPCVAGTSKFVCIGLNYSDHAAETGMAVPSEPIIFMKANSAICGMGLLEWLHSAQSACDYDAQNSELRESVQHSRSSRRHLCQGAPVAV